MSERQLAANRRNALRSTGPRTLKGREVSKMNALKHGILSRQVLVSGQHYQEDREEFEALHQRFTEDLQPEGPLEEMLVDQIVTAHWRLRRALTAESGAIAMRVDKGHRKRAKGTHPALLWMRWKALGDPIHPMEESSLGCGVLISYMRDVRAEVEQAGMLTGESVQRLVARFGEPNILTKSLEDLRLQLEAEPDGPDLAQRKRDKALAFVDRKVDSLYLSKERCVEDEEHEDASRDAASVLPSGEELDKILRYETKLERQLYRAMAQLERVQRMRRGEAIPAPLSVEVSGQS
jgi:hypothetical protein